MIERELLMDLRAEIMKMAREEVKKAIEEHDRTTDKRTETHTCDLIDRQAAIKVILKVPDGNWNQKRYAQEIRKLPPVDIRKQTVDIGYLYEWYQDSVDPDDEPVWTEKHIEEIFHDFYLIPKQEGEDG